VKPIQTQRDTFAIRLAMPWYHTTDSELNPGDEILPASKRGVPNRWESKDYDPSLVYFTQGPQRLPQEDLDNSPFGKHTYEVQPQGDIQRDPEWESNKKSYGSDYEYEDEIPGAQDYAAPSAKIVRKYHPDNWKTPIPKQASNPFADFTAWCMTNHFPMDTQSLGRFVQAENLPAQVYRDLSAFMAGMRYMD
jgi:hypothetical protein